MYRNLNLVNLVPFFPMGLMKTVHLIVVSRLSTEKHIEVFIEIVSCLREAVPEISAAIVGDGSLKQELEELASKLGLQEVVSFHGHISSPDLLNRILNNAKIFVLNSAHEGGPYTIMEAMAAGLCCVSSSVGEVTQIIKHDYNGFIIDKHDHVQAYVDIVLELLRDVKRLRRIQERATEIKSMQDTSLPENTWKEIVLARQDAV